MKILFTSPNPYLNLAAPAGYAAHMNGTIGGFRNAGHEVKTLINGGETLAGNHTIATAKPRVSGLKSMVPTAVWETMKDYRLRSSDVQFQHRVSSAFEAFGPDLVYERANYLQGSVMRAVKGKGVPYFIEVNAPFTEERAALQGPSWMIPKARQTFIEQLKAADRIFVVSSILKDHVCKLAGIEAQKVIVTPNAVTDDQIMPDPEVFQRDKVVLGFIGSILAWHGVEHLITAFNQAAPAHDRLHLLIVGGGEALESLKQQAARSAFKARITLTGNVPRSEVKDYLKQMDVCVMPASNWYGSPVKIFEYGAAGKTIVAPDKVPVKDVMEHGKDGLLIAEAGQLYPTLQQLLENPEASRNMALTFHQKVVNQYTWDHIAQQIMEAYEDCAAH